MLMYINGIHKLCQHNIPLFMLKINEKMAYCKHCDKEVEPVQKGNRYFCPDCKKFVNVTKEENEEVQVAEIPQSKETTKKSKKERKKEQNKKKKKKTMAQIQEQEMMKAYIDSMKKGDSSDPLMTMMMMKMLENQGKGVDSGDNGFMKDLMQMQMMKMMSGGDNQQTNALQRELVDLKQNMQMSQIMSQQSQTQHGSQMNQEYLTKMENIRADRDKELKKMEVDAQRQRDKNMQLVFETKVKEIQHDMQRATEEAKSKGGKADLSSFKDQLTMIKELNNMVGEREKGAGEYISETISNVAGQLQPAITNYMQQQQQKSMQPQYPQVPPMAEQPSQEVPSQEVPAYEEPEFPMPNANMTDSEQNMSSVMSSIYISPPEKKTE